MTGTMGEIDESKSRGQFAAGTGLLELRLAKNLLVYFSRSTSFYIRAHNCHRIHVGRSGGRAETIMRMRQLLKNIARETVYLGNR